MMPDRPYLVLNKTVKLFIFLVCIWGICALIWSETNWNRKVRTICTWFSGWCGLGVWTTVVASRAVLIRNCKNQPVLRQAERILFLADTCLIWRNFSITFRLLVCILRARFGLFKEDCFAESGNTYSRTGEKFSKTMLCQSALQWISTKFMSSIRFLWKYLWQPWNTWSS